MSNLVTFGDALSLLLDRYVPYGFKTNVHLLNQMFCCIMGRLLFNRRTNILSHWPHPLQYNNLVGEYGSGPDQSG